jgi:hypothetical protein
MGKQAHDGDEYTSQNGYRYRRVLGKWISVHILVAEEQLGRKLQPNESAYFKDGDRTNLAATNIGIRIKGGGKSHARLAAIEERIRELEAERELILKDLEASKARSS